MDNTTAVQSAAATKAQELARDLEELQSRGFGHPQADQIAGRMRVTLQQLQDDFAAPPPRDPVPETAMEILGKVQAQFMELHDVLCHIKAALNLSQVP